MTMDWINWHIKNINNSINALREVDMEIHDTSDVEFILEGIEFNKEADAIVATFTESEIDIKDRFIMQALKKQYY